MKKYLLILISAIIIHVAWLYISTKLPPFSTCEGLVCGGLIVLIFFYHIILIPIIFGIFGYLVSKENRLKQSLYYLGTSLIGAVIVFLPLYIKANIETRQKAEQDFQEMKARYEANPEQYKQRPY